MTIRESDLNISIKNNQMHVSYNYNGEELKRSQTFEDCYYVTLFRIVQNLEMRMIFMNAISIMIQNTKEC